MSAFAWAVLTALIWGVVPLLEKAGLKSSDPTIGVFARSVGVLVAVGTGVGVAVGTGVGVGVGLLHAAMRVKATARASAENILVDISDTLVCIGVACIDCSYWKLNPRITTLP